MPVQEIMEDLFFIERGYLNANHFVYRAENPVLIDTGYVSDFNILTKTTTQNTDRFSMFFLNGGLSSKKRIFFLPR